MSDDAQTPGAAAGDESGARPEDAAPAAKVPLSKPPAEPNPWAPPTDAAPGDGSGPTPPSVHDQQTVTSLPGGMPQIPGAGTGAATPVPPGSTPSGPPSWANPFAPPAASAPPNPFGPPAGAPHPYAPPAGPHLHSTPGSSVPPPPIAPEGPGQMPYGYGGYPGYPSYGGPGGGPGYGWPGMPMAPSNGLGTAGLVLGIIAAVGFCLWPVALACGILAVIFGAIGRGKARRGEATNPGQALAGIICGAVGIALAIAFAVVFLIVPDDSDSDSGTVDDGFNTSLFVNG
ncbi:DUF4190 domain-containing protein [Streptomyces phaeochromogenes]|uniref:DUF4190 domain-containing protein n=1 Tax=Streptomyces phaeochromogenes TaxID=1923 RepID=UPI00225866DA|nr:DUF4190 domain-containing protein [Streptomyces phaeochromogenes]MCX5601059.1 DUF4190 domain-containing protein [Streptomyces phaeochromogenes]WSJ08382.1 DUF4190 domain-containing protein [Streptomyces phaeochromogenes]